MNSIYYEPEKFGLEIIDEVHERDLSYEFNMIVVWRELGSGVYLWGQDSGCSCPSPFEDKTEYELERLNKHTWESFKNDLSSMNAPLDEKLETIHNLEYLGVHERHS